VRSLAFPRNRDGTPKTPRFVVSDTLVDALGSLVVCAHAFPFIGDSILQVVLDIREGLQLEPEQYVPRDPRGALQRRLWHGLADTEERVKKEMKDGKNLNKSIV